MFLTPKICLKSHIIEQIKIIRIVNIFIQHISLEDSLDIRPLRKIKAKQLNGVDFRANFLLCFVNWIF